jgi:hypothetical protein
MSDTVDVLALALAAKAKGYDAPDELVKRLEGVIKRQQDYVRGREIRRRTTSIDEVIKEDNEAIAMAIVLIESIVEPAMLEASTKTEKENNI